MSYSSVHILATAASAPIILNDAHRLQADYELKINSSPYDLAAPPAPVQADLLLIHASEITADWLHHFRLHNPTLPVTLLLDEADEQQGLGWIKRGVFDYLTLDTLDTYGLYRALCYAASARLVPDHYARIIELSTDGIILTDERGQIRVWNAAMFTLTGIPEAEALNLYLWDIHERVSPDMADTPHLLDGLRERLLAMQRTGIMSPESSSMEQFVRHADGRLLYVQISNFIIRTENGYMLSSICRDITRSHEAEQALYKLSRVVEQSSNSIVITSIDGTIEYVNPHFTRLTGYTAEEAIGQNPRILQSGLTPPEIFDSLWETISRGEVWQGEFINRKKNGDMYWEEATISAIRGSDGRMTHYLATKLDITTRKQAEQSLLKFNEQLQLLNHILSVSSSLMEQQQFLTVLCEVLARQFQASGVFALMTDDTDRTLHPVASHSECKDFTRLWGWLVANTPLMQQLRRDPAPRVITDPGELAIFEFTRCQPQQDNGWLIIPLIVRAEVAGMLLLNVPHYYSIPEADQPLITSIIQATAQTLENSRLHQQLADNNTRLEQIINERTGQLIRLNERLSAILDNVSDAIVLVQREGTIDTTNPAFGHLFGYEPDEMFGAPITALAAADDMPLFSDSITSVLVKGRSSLQIRAQRKDHTEFDADIALAYVPDNQGHIICSIRDITHRKELERIKDQFISTVSHELRTPATSIMLSAVSLQKYFDRMTDDQRRQTIERLNTQVGVLTEMIEGILDISRIEARQPVGITNRCDLTLLAEQVLTELQSQLQGKSQLVETGFNTLTPDIPGEALDFTRIWRNLIINASKYTPEGGRITVRLGDLWQMTGGQTRCSQHIDPASLRLPPDLPPGQYLLGQVEDTGVGIPESNIHHLFTRFFRGWAGQSSIPGTGLGLALVRELLQLYDGDISVTSEVDKGSIFSFWIPVEKDFTP